MSSYLAGLGCSLFYAFQY